MVNNGVRVVVPALGFWVDADNGTRVGRLFFCSSILRMVGGQIRGSKSEKNLEEKSKKWDCGDYSCYGGACFYQL